MMPTLTKKRFRNSHVVVIFGCLATLAYVGGILLAAVGAVLTLAAASLGIYFKTAMD